MNLDSQSIKSKFHLPKLRQTQVHRRRLLNQLQTGVRQSLTLVSAPPGFGKTTLLAEWATSESRPIIWLSLDSEDNDPVQFASNLVYAFEFFQASVSSQLTSPD